MIIDFHTHVFPSFFKDGRFRFFSQEPAFKMLYRSPGAKLAGTKELLRTMDEEHVQKSVIFGFPWEMADHYRRHNDYIIEAVQDNAERFIGLCCFSPLSPGGPEEIERCLKSGLSGVGELALYGAGLSLKVIDALRETMALCAELDVPILLHTNEPVGHNYAGKTPMTLAEIYRFLKAYPSNRIILAHWGGGLFFYAFMKKVVKETLRNVWFDTAASPYLYTPDTYRVAVEAIGSNKILFGSDFPLLKPQRYFEEMASAGLSPKDVERMKGLNAAELLRLPG
jgi:predicted TIM-barrel fold metal-dependent hydrolase